MKKLKLIGLVLLAFLFVAACGNNANNENNPVNNNQAGNNQTEEPESVSPAVAEKADTIFSKSCIQCHGTDLQGLMGDKSNLQSVGARLSREDIATTIREGRNQMPAFGDQLDDDEIEVLAEWLAAKK